jgi:hypothetical protein
VRSSAERPWWSDDFGVAEELMMRRHWVNGNDEGVGAMLLCRTAAVSLRPARLGGGEIGRRQALLVFVGEREEGETRSGKREGPGSVGAWCMRRKWACSAAVPRRSSHGSASATLAHHAVGTGETERGKERARSGLHLSAKEGEREREGKWTR